MASGAQAYAAASASESTEATGGNVGMGECCLSGKINRPGNPTGHEDEIGGLKTYVSEPESGAKTKTIIFIPDIFGWEVRNTRLLADNYAKAGFYVYLPDVHEADDLPEELLQDIEPRRELTMTEKATSTANVATTLGPWLVKHREAVSKPLIDGFINAVRMIPGTDKVGTIGFCWGGRYSILAAHGADKPGQGVDAAYACHPSLVAIPGDFEPVKKPLSLALGSKDSLLGEKEIGQIREVMDKKSDVPHEIRVYEDQVHGFALRGDFKSEKDKKDMDEAEKQGIDWFNKYL